MERIKTSVMYQLRILYTNTDWYYHGSHSRFDRIFNSCFNMNLDQINILVMRSRWTWEEDVDMIWNIMHFLWTLVCLKRYPTYDQLECEIGHEKN